ncbi:hypothetical protein BJ138DRAFT_1148781 [Hygrophoropsis aurantiaca]|uniref:Uncharacterized protein n=1 Tax=Hygrophoropsis aurantiaca TaxID=72124 RepID=A0ACB8AFQ3_9AGAM|nr:hypothetical protein BJ138DRAFT_1148781 [Hygrophoropsis aurantiaca]
MPTTRSSSKQPSVSQPQAQQPVPMPPSPAPQYAHNQTKTTSSREPVIVLSSDDEPARKKTKTSKLKPTAKRTAVKKTAKKSALPVCDDILELTDSEDDVVRTSSKKPGPAPGPSAKSESEISKQLKRLEQENRKLRNQYSLECQTVTQLKSKFEETTAKLKDEIDRLKPGGGGQKIDILKLDDHISCEVCANKMWSPYILPDCGHSFCETCLVDWFNTTLSQHMARHPAYNPRSPTTDLTNLVQQMLTLAHGPLLPYAQAFLGAYYQLQPMGGANNESKPEYTCPVCRNQVKIKPVEDFKLKALVGEVASTCGEKVSHQKASQRGGPFDIFFAQG